MSILTSNMKVSKIVQKHFLCTFSGFLVTIICDVKIDVNMCEPHYVNLFVLWTSSIVHVCNFLTFDIFLTTWHLFDIWAIGHVGNATHGLRGIVVNTADRDRTPWGMGHMGNGAHGHNFLNTLGILTKFQQHIDIDVFYLNFQWFFHDGLI